MIMRRLRAPIALTMLSTAMLWLVMTVACTRPEPVGPRVIVLGFDGLDYDVTRTMIAGGGLPGLARLAQSGGFSALGTTVPPQSPVAWSTFITGLDPGGHGIFDFVHRDPATMVPYLSTSRVEPGSRALPLGRWQLPLSSGRAELLRRGQPFWEVLEARGVPTTIIRMPANFPPSGTATRELSGMGTPDLLGTYGTFGYYTSEPFAFRGREVSGGVVFPVTVRSGAVDAQLVGPDNPFLRQPTKATADFQALLAADRRHVKLVVGDEHRLLAVGEWSDWVPVSFSLAPTQQLKGQVRFYLKSLDPFFELYASPINLDPFAPAMPMSHPASYAAELAAATGRFHTQGMPETTNSLKSGVLTDAEFLQQAALAAEENRRQYRDVLDKFAGGLLFYYFGNLDQVSHMMWRPRDPGHPAYHEATDAPHAGVVEALYRGLDAIVMDTLATLGPDDLLVVMSDHGFTSWRRAFHLNSWLRDAGYLVAADPARQSETDAFSHLDWSRTRAYGLGLNGLYLNLQGRERNGIVSAAERDALLDEITSGLLAFVDPATGAPAITKVYRSAEVYQHAGHEHVAPDLVIGYAKGTRGSDESALGGLPRDVIVDNISKWNGDHCMDHEAVPGVLLASRPLRRSAPTIQSLAAAVLAEFGVEAFPIADEDR
jgi:predicted AlkP superfamily phosphohydrolase/phosphomutase